jgi:hypothetical protein
MKTIHSLVSKDLGYIFGERESGPNGAKKQFHSKSAAFLRTLGNELGLKEFKVSKNYGGIAVSGEITLMGLWGEGNGVYFQIFQSLPGRQQFLYRNISHMKDFSGGTNRWMDCEMFANGDYEAVLDALLSLKKPVATTTNATTEAVSRFAA